ncbi:MAG: CRISPR-associated endonuclease Cas1 [Candidatus Micrarchaeia archaeon]
MELVINDYAAFIGRRSERFYVRIPEKPEEEFAAEKVEQILIARASSISMGAIELAMEHDIDITYLDWRGTPLARTYPCKLGGTTLIRKKQLEASATPTGARIIKSIIDAKVKNQAYLLKALAKERPNEKVTRNANIIISQVEKIDLLELNLAKVGETLLGIEGYCGSLYWDALSELMPLGNRDKKGDNLTNAFLNYGYGILYSEVERACIISGLDPYLGFYHKDRYGKPSMVLDLIENFRPVIVDRAVITIFSRKMATEEDFEGGRLSKSGRDKILSEVLKRLTTEISFEGRRASIKDLILRQSRNIARALTDDNYKFRAFVHKW